MNNIFKIVCLDKAAQIPKIVKAVFNSIPHSLEVLKTLNKLDDFLHTDRNDLLIINIVNTKISVEDVKKIKITNPDISIIIIDKQPEAIEKWINFENIKFLTSSEIVQKLPLFLGEIYSKSNDNFYSRFSYLDLLKNCLRRVEQLVIILDTDSNILFLNQTAEKVLGVQEQDNAGTPLIDFIVDGNKVWNYIVDKCLFRDEHIEKYVIRFKDAQNIEHQKQISVKKLENENDYFLLESCDSALIIDKHNSGDEYQLLNKFADSIANELINPMNIISGRLQLLQSDLSNNDKYQKSLNTLEKQVDRINEIMSKLLTFARLKQDTIPQKINLNDLFKKILLEPSVMRLLEREGIEFKYSLMKELPILSGLMSHFDLLIKTILEICFECLGNKGRILVETNCLNNYLKQDWVTFKVNIDYLESSFAKKQCLHAYLGKDHSEVQGISIESTIIGHIIRHYHGIYQLTRDDQHKEMINILFPLPKSR